MARPVKFEAGKSDLFVSPLGSDRWSGTLAAPNRSRTDGPFLTLDRARREIRRRKGEIAQGQTAVELPRWDGPFTVWLRGGTYRLDEPLVFGPQDSGPVTFAAYPGEQPVLDGGQTIDNWSTTEINGAKAWVADVPEVRAGRWHFRSLFVNGQRAPRPRRPHDNLFRMAEAPGMKLPAGWGVGGQDRFVCNPGEVESFANLNDVEVVYVHFWIEERSPIAAFDPASNLVTMTRPSRAPLVGAHGSKLADYYLDNVREELRQPGQWYLDRQAGKLYYLPRPGQTPRNTRVVAPRLLQLLGLVGKPDEGQYVENLTFRGLTFRHTDWRHPDPSDGATFIRDEKDVHRFTSRRHFRGNLAGSGQAANDVPGALFLEAARQCVIEDCTIEHVGWYGVEFSDGSCNNKLVGCTIRDLGAGGVKINGAAARDPAQRRTGRIHVTDNHIHDGGRIFHCAVGILTMHAHEMEIVHNHIHDLFYTGISCGWLWGYAENVSRDNLIAFNHIHDLGKGLLSDMGGIYTLGVQPGTVLRNNLIHDISSAHYGGWCIYPDEGSSHLLIENNVCYNADRQPFHQHYGRENLIRNNIFAFGGEAVGRYTRWEPHRGYQWLNNIMVTDGKPIWTGEHPADKEATRMAANLNVFFDVSGQPVHFVVAGKRLTLDQWRSLGRDSQSVDADPKFANLAKRDFRLAKDSPALALGFEPIDISTVGPRPKSRR